MFRLHMDFPLTANETDSLAATNKFVEFLSKNENGHVANKKSRIHLLSSTDEVE